MTTFTWDNADFTWNDNSYTWDEVVLVQEILRKLPGEGFDVDMQWMHWSDGDDDKKKKKLINLILKVHGKTITESKQREIKQYKIKASDIKLTVKKVLGIDLVTENIKF